MLKGCVLAVALTLLAALPCQAQSYDIQATSRVDDEEPNPDAYRVWLRLEYLLWQLQRTPLPSALVTNGGPVNLGVIGAADTNILYGGSQDYGLMSGSGLAGGLWFDADSRIGIEGSFFLFGSRSEYFNASAPAGGVLSLPFTSVTGNVPTPTVLNLATPSTTLPTQFGSVNIENDIRFLGGNLDFVIVPYRNSFFELNFLGGFTSVYLKEDLYQNYSTTTTSASSIAGTTTTTTMTSQVHDTFSTQNIFYGSDLGVRGIFRWRPFFLELTGRLALGENDQIVDIAGQSTNNITNVSVGKINSTTTSSTTSNTGFLAQSSNIGNYSRNSFCLMPQGQVRVGVDLTANIKLSVGYDILYLSNVVRPGNQIDQIMGTLNGVTHPTFSFNSSSFYAQGVNVGMEFRY